MFLEIPAADRIGYVMPECAAAYLRSVSALSEEFKRIFKEAGIKTDADGVDSSRKRAFVSFHSLRHTFVSLAANAGVPLAVVQSIVGHSTVDMTRHYFHESETALVSAVAALPSVAGGETEDGSGGGMSPRVRSICTLADELTEAERGELLRYLQGAANDPGRGGLPLIQARAASTGAA
jgi:hypothetical protein